MPIEDPNIAPTSSPVLKHTAIGEKFVGVMCAFKKQRDRTKDNAPMLKPNGKVAQELVLTMMTMPGTTMQVGKVGEHRTPETGEVVRAILKGKSFGHFIDANNALGGKVGVGYIVEIGTDVAQAYDEKGAAIGPELRTQAECDAVPRGRTLGYYGPLTIHVPTTADEVAWDTKASAYFNDANRPVETAPVEDFAPF